MTRISECDLCPAHSVRREFPLTRPFWLATLLVIWLAACGLLPASAAESETIDPWEDLLAGRIDLDQALAAVETAPDQLFPI